MNTPMIFSWDGESFTPLNRFARFCDQEFVIGQQYRMDIVEERSAKSHSHFFARLHDIWLTLPEGIDQQFLAEEYFRKHLLIKAGYYNLRTYVASNKAEVQRVIAWSRGSEYAIITVDGLVVNEYTAKSQAQAAMRGAEFQACKTKVLELAEAMIGIERSAAT